MAYTKPETVLSPKGMVRDLEVLFNSGSGGWALVRMLWHDKPAYGMRWNGSEDGEGVGQPQSRGNPTWFLIPEEFAREAQDVFGRLARHREEGLIDGYRRMAADREREREADEWIEGLENDEER